MMNHQLPNQKKAKIYSEETIWDRRWTDFCILLGNTVSCGENTTFFAGTCLGISGTLVVKNTIYHRQTIPEKRIMEPNMMTSNLRFGSCSALILNILNVLSLGKVSKTPSESGYIGTTSILN